ncbi:MAG: restriction endonuclease [Candidatus Aenigmarchaeota archaeon]|nr:restriction endonuclease [Candidatus Aenigmarchaeota archaeon]
MYVVKADGRRETFSKEKIINTCLKAGTDRKKAEEISGKVFSSVKDGIATKEIYRMILNLLEKASHRSSFFFRLRDAIAKLDSESYELYVKELLESMGYKCSWNKIIAGKSVEHQVDIVAKNAKGRMFLVECKRHVNPHRFCGLGVILQVQARLEDIDDGFESGKNNCRFDQAWIFNNTKFSEHAKQYAAAKNILLSGWGYKGSISIEKLAGRNRIYPVTLLKADNSTIQQLLRQKIITVEDVLKEKISMPKSVADELRKQARIILS